MSVDDAYTGTVRGETYAYARDGRDETEEYVVVHLRYSAARLI